MLMNLLLGLGTMVLCLLLQTMLVIAAFNYYNRHADQVNDPSFRSSVRVVGGVMILLVLGNLAQVAFWALLFQWLGEFGNFSDAFYHSGVNFSTLGYGDFVMSEQHRLLGPLESINGVLMIGVTSAALMTAFQDAMRKTLSARRD